MAGGTDLMVHWHVRPEAHQHTFVDLSRLEALHVPRRRYSYQVFEKVGSRRAQAIAKVGLAVTRSDAGWRVVAASVAPTIRRCPAVERLLETGAAVASPSDLLPAIAQDVAPIDDIRSTAHYRTLVMARLLYHDLRDFWGK